MSLNVQGDSVGAVQFAVRAELGYESDSRKGRKADEATGHALAYVTRADRSINTPLYVSQSGMTYERWLTKTTEQHVRSSMGFIWTIFLSGMISAVVRLIIEWWLSRPTAEK